MKIIVPVIVLLLLFSLSYCESDSDSNNEQDLQEVLADLEIDRYTDVDAASHATCDWNSEWEQYFFDTEDCRCILGSEFSVYVHDQGVNNVMLYLEGGGACIPVIYADSCSTEVGTGGVETLIEANLFPEWNHIFVPYCDGSVHMGDNDADYDEDGTVDHYHWGLKNVSAAIGLMKELYPSPDNIVLGGSSGGGYGTFLAFAVLRSLYPDVPVCIYNDAGPGIFNPDNPSVYESMQETWQYTQFLPESCELCQNHTTYLYDFYLNLDPNLKIGMFSGYQDYVIGVFFLLMTGEEFQNTLLSITDEIIDHHPDNFKRFFAVGEGHTCLEYGLDYEVDGITIREWLYAMVDGTSEWVDNLE